VLQQGLLLPLPSKSLQAIYKRGAFFVIVVVVVVVCGGRQASAGPTKFRATRRRPHWRPPGRGTTRPERPSARCRRNGAAERHWRAAPVGGFWWLNVGGWTGGWMDGWIHGCLDPDGPRALERGSGHSRGGLVSFGRVAALGADLLCPPLPFPQVFFSFFLVPGPLLTAHKRPFSFSAVGTLVLNCLWQSVLRPEGHHAVHTSDRLDPTLWLAGPGVLG